MQSYIATHINAKSPRIVTDLFDEIEVAPAVNVGPAVVELVVLGLPVND